MVAYLLVALGSAIGGVARYASTLAAILMFGPTFPWGTIFVNIVGSFLISCIAIASANDLVGGNTRLLLASGFCGGFTTFSAFSLETLTLLQQGDLARAALNIVGSVLLCLLAVWIGVLFANQVYPVKG